jgi:hypothetical protein
MFAVVLVYAGFLAMFVGALSQHKPLSFLLMPNTRRGMKVFAAGLLSAALGFSFPAPQRQVWPRHTQMDYFSPIYQFREFHSLEVKAPKHAVYSAIRSVTANEIPLYRTLTWIRRFGRPGRENILNPPPDRPLLEVATRTGFLLLAIAPDREVLVGTAVLAPKSWQPTRQVLPEDFRVIDQEGFALATMNFLIEETGPQTCVVSTETRVYATDSASSAKFARYWRMIYPGSAFLRRMWLLAIKRRAEQAAR